MTATEPTLPPLQGEQAAEVWARTRDLHLRRVEVLERAVLALMDGALDDELRELAESEAHSLASLVGTFGLRAGSRLARGLEQSFSARHTLGRSLAARLADQVLALRRELERPLAPAAVAEGQELPQVLLLTDGARGDHYVTEGVTIGLQVVVRAVAQGNLAITEDPPDVVVIEVGDGDVERAVFLLDAIARRAPGPVLVVSPDDGMAMRLAIARSGAVGPLMPGLPPAVVLERAQALLASRMNASGSVLVVDSDPWALEHATLVLEQAGHRVKALPDPQRFWETLDAVSPDLVLLGVGMTGVTGLELCQALRADPRWREMPVVFMAGGAEAELVKGAYRAGGDDVLRKPLERTELLARLENRLQRTRLLRRNADTDGITGLPGRQKAEREIERFLQLGRRHRHPVTLVTLRIDRFDDLAPRVGLAAAEAALLAFSQLLIQSFRSEDVISQWGPNEFVVGLFDANTANATVRVREVMAALRERTFRAPSGESFGLTCSAGIASFPEDASDTRELHAAADAALLVAGGAGAEEALGIASDPNTRVTGRVDVLLIEDDASVATLLIHSLEARQYQVRWLRSGQEAASALLGDRPEIRARLILLEVNLPELDGLALLRGLAAQDVLKHTRVIVLSSRTTEAETVQAFELGAFDYVPKPFSMAVLAERIRRALRA